MVIVIFYQSVTVDIVCFCLFVRHPGSGQLADGTFTIESEYVTHFGIYVDIPDLSKYDCPPAENNSVTHQPTNRKGETAMALDIHHKRGLTHEDFGETKNRRRDEDTF